MTNENNNFEDINIGDEASFSRVITADDLSKFSELSGDFNPLHLDETYASQTEFGDRVVYGFLLGALVSRLIGMQLPGKRALIIKESLEFKLPAKIGDELIVKGEVVYKSKSTSLLEIAVTINQQEKILTTGNVYVRILKLKNEK